MSDLGLTEADLAGLCARAFGDRHRQRIASIKRLPSRQHEVIAFRLHWSTPLGEMDEALIARRYVSALSWWRLDDNGKAQREASVGEWLYEQGFPAPAVYAREFGTLGDVVLFSRLPGADWSADGRSFPDLVRPHVDRFAALLALLHRLTPPEAVRQVTPVVTLPMALANLLALAMQTGSAELIRAVETTMNRAYSLAETPPVFLHGDYHFSNALLFEDRISGIVDWEYAALGDPRWDVANAYSQLVDFDAASAADEFLAAYLRYSGRQFDGPPLYLTVVPLQQWTVSEWLVKQQEDGRAPTFTMAQDLMALRDVHRHRALAALGWL